MGHEDETAEVGPHLDGCCKPECRQAGNRAPVPLRRCSREQVKKQAREPGRLACQDWGGTGGANASAGQPVGGRRPEQDRATSWQAAAWEKPGQLWENRQDPLGRQRAG